MNKKQIREICKEMYYIGLNNVPEYLFDQYFEDSYTKELKKNDK